MEEQPQIEVGQQPAIGEARCQVVMGTSKKDPICLRPLHNAPDGVDPQPVCLMHSLDPIKQRGEMFHAFWREFNEILNAAGSGTAHFDKFLFPTVNLTGQTIEAECVFHYATFSEGAYFNKAIFKQKADFTNAYFAQRAFFSGTSFMQDTYFDSASFTCEVHFVGSEFSETVEWKNSVFSENAEFRHTKFLCQSEQKPSTVFALANFAQQGKIVFDDVDLSRALFHNCNVSEIWFTSSVNWGQRHGRKAIIFEETIPLEQDHAADLRRKDKRQNAERDYRAVAQIYQQLTKNYDARLAYRTANDFHFGDMEMRRLAAPDKGPLLPLRQWWHRHLSFIALYRLASNYGNSYTKPVWWLLGTILVCAAIFPIIGLQHSDPKYIETYGSVWDWARTSAGHGLFHEAGLVGKSLLTSLDAATFQRNPEYSPVYPWGRALAILETLLTSTLFGLFLLAIRRQFRR